MCCHYIVSWQIDLTLEINIEIMFQSIYLFFFTPDYNVFSFLRTQSMMFSVGASNLKFAMFFTLYGSDFVQFKTQKYRFFSFFFFSEKLSDVHIFLSDLNA